KDLPRPRRGQSSAIVRPWFDYPSTEGAIQALLSEQNAIEKLANSGVGNIGPGHENCNDIVPKTTIKLFLRKCDGTTGGN
ncbi:MAG: hypothetical protein ACXVBX_06255, partial [Flavisolibacter sp.]